MDSTMKNKLIYIYLCTLALCLGACHSQPKEKSTREATLQTNPAQKGPQRMVVSENKEYIDLRGKKYQSKVVRRPDENLPQVRNEEGLTFVDNTVVLQLVCEGKTLVNKSFTKQDFASLVEPSFLKNAILEGIVYDKTTSQGIHYAASVGYPETDLYQPIRLIISPSGTISMAKEEQMVEVAETEEEK